MSETARSFPANSPSEVVRLERRDDDVVEVFTSIAESEVWTFDAKNIDRGQLRAGTLLDIVSLHAERPAFELCRSEAVAMFAIVRVAIRDPLLTAHFGTRRHATVVDLTADLRLFTDVAAFDHKICCLEADYFLRHGEPSEGLLTNWTSMGRFLSVAEEKTDEVRQLWFATVARRVLLRQAGTKAEMRAKALQSLEVVLNFQDSVLDDFIAKAEVVLDVEPLESCTVTKMPNLRMMTIQEGPVRDGGSLQVLCEIYLKAKGQKMAETSKCFWLVRWGDSLRLFDKVLVFDAEPDILAAIAKYRLYHVERCQQKLSLTPTKRQQLREQLEDCEGSELRNRQLLEGVDTVVVSPLRVPWTNGKVLRQTALLVSRMRNVLTKILIRRVRVVVRRFRANHDDRLRRQLIEERLAFGEAMAQSVGTNLLLATPVSDDGLYDEIVTSRTSEEDISRASKESEGVAKSDEARAMFGSVESVVGLAQGPIPSEPTRTRGQAMRAVMAEGAVMLDEAEQQRRADKDMRALLSSEDCRKSLMRVLKLSSSSALGNDAELGLDLLRAHVSTITRGSVGVGTAVSKSVREAASAVESRSPTLQSVRGGAADLLCGEFPIQKLEPSSEFRPEVASAKQTIAWQPSSMKSPSGLDAASFLKICDSAYMTSGRWEPALKLWTTEQSVRVKFFSGECDVEKQRIKSLNDVNVVFRLQFGGVEKKGEEHEECLAKEVSQKERSDKERRVAFEKEEEEKEKAKGLKLAKLIEERRKQEDVERLMKQKMSVRVIQWIPPTSQTGYNGFNPEKFVEGAKEVLWTTGLRGERRGEPCFSVSVRDETGQSEKLVVQTYAKLAIVAASRVEDFDSRRMRFEIVTSRKSGEDVSRASKESEGVVKSDEAKAMFGSVESVVGLAQGPIPSEPTRLGTVAETKEGRGSEVTKLVRRKAMKGDRRHSRWEIVEADEVASEGEHVESYVRMTTKADDGGKWKKYVDYYVLRRGKDKFVRLPVVGRVKLSSEMKIQVEAYEEWHVAAHGVSPGEALDEQREVEQEKHFAERHIIEWFPLDDEEYDEEEVGTFLSKCDKLLRMERGLVPCYVVNEVKNGKVKVDVFKRILRVNREELVDLDSMAVEIRVPLKEKEEVKEEKGFSKRGGGRGDDVARPKIVVRAREADQLRTIPVVDDLRMSDESKGATVDQYVMVRGMGGYFLVTLENGEERIVSERRKEVLSYKGWSAKVREYREWHLKEAGMSFEEKIHGLREGIQTGRRKVAWDDVESSSDEDRDGEDKEVMEGVMRACRDLYLHLNNEERYMPPTAWTTEQRSYFLKYGKFPADAPRSHLELRQKCGKALMFKFDGWSGVKETMNKMERASNYFASKCVVMQEHWESTPDSPLLATRSENEDLVKGVPLKDVFTDPRKLQETMQMDGSEGDVLIWVAASKEEWKLMRKKLLGKNVFQDTKQQVRDAEARASGLHSDDVVKRRLAVSESFLKAHERGSVGQRDVYQEEQDRREGRSGVRYNGESSRSIKDKLHEEIFGSSMSKRASKTQRVMMRSGLEGRDVSDSSSGEESDEDDNESSEDDEDVSSQATKSKLRRKQRIELKVDGKRGKKETKRRSVEKERLTRDEERRGLEHCSSKLCDRLLMPREKICPECAFPRWDRCFCQECGSSYDPNLSSKCSVCTEWLPHAEGYEQERMLKSRIMLMDQGGSKAASKATKEKEDVGILKTKRQLENGVAMFVLDRAGAEVPTLVQAVGNLGDLKERFLIEMRSAALSESVGVSPVDEFTGDVSRESMIDAMVRFRWGCETKTDQGGMSLWQCKPHEGSFIEDLYFHEEVDKTGKGKTLTVAEMKMLKKYVSLKKFEGMMRNMAALRGALFGESRGEEILEALLVIKSYYLSKPKSVRDQKVSLYFWVEVMDMVMAQQHRVVEEMVRCRKTMTKAEQLRNLEDKFRHVNWESNGLERVPMIEIRKWCEEHCCKEVTAESWPKKPWHCKCHWSKLVEDELEKYEDYDCPAFVINEIDHTVFTLDRRNKQGENKPRAGNSLSEEHAGSAGWMHNQGYDTFEEKGIVRCIGKGWIDKALKQDNKKAMTRWIERGQREFKKYAKTLGYVPSGSKQVCFKQVAKYSTQAEDLTDKKFDSQHRHCGDSCDLDHSIPPSILKKMSDKTFKVKCPFAWLYLRSHRGGNRFANGAVPVVEKKHRLVAIQKLKSSCANLRAWCLAADAKDQALSDQPLEDYVSDEEDEDVEVLSDGAREKAKRQALIEVAKNVSLEDEESLEHVDEFLIKTSKANDASGKSSKGKKSDDELSKSKAAENNGLTATKKTQRTTAPKPKEAKQTKKTVSFTPPVPLSRDVDPAQASKALDFSKNDKRKELDMKRVESNAKKYDQEEKLKSTDFWKNRQGGIPWESAPRSWSEDEPVTVSDVNVASQHEMFFRGLPMKLIDSADGPNFKVFVSNSNWSSIGGIPILSQFDLSFSFYSKVKDGMVKGSLTVVDLGEVFDNMSRQCETIATAGALRVSVSSVRVQQLKDVKRWRQHHKKDGVYGSMFYEALEDAAVAEGVSRQAAARESEAVTNILGRSQPLAPMFGLMALGDYANDVGQLHVFVHSNNTMDWLLGVPLSYDFDGSTKSMPVVTKVYSDTHASVGVWKDLQVDDRVFKCTESLTSTAPGSGEWLTVGELLDAHKQINLQFPFRVALAVSMEEKLKRKVYDGVPGYVLQPMQIGGEDEDKVGDSKCGESNSVGGVGPSDVAAMQEVMSIEEMLGESQSLGEKEVAKQADVNESMTQMQVSSTVIPSQESEDDSRVSEEAVRGAVYSVEKGWSASGKDVVEEISIEEVEEEVEVTGRDENEDRAAALAKASLGTRMCGIEDLIRSDEEQRRLKEERWVSYEGFVWEGRKVTVPEKVGKEEASILLIRAVKAVLRHEKEAYNKTQSKMDPGDGWMNLYGVLMEQVIIYVEIVFREDPSFERPRRCEELFRALGQEGRVTSQMNSWVIDEFFADLPEDAKEDLRKVMETGVEVGIDRTKRTGRATPSPIAKQHKEKVKKNMRKFTALGHVRAIPPSCRHLVRSWNLEISPVHYVPSDKYKAQDRVVANLSKADDERKSSEGMDINSRSEDPGYHDVQADYFDEVATQFVNFLTLSHALSGARLMQIVADIKSAFKVVGLSLSSFGSCCVEFEDWIYVYTKTPFGWKWASHTWSIFARAIKFKVRSFERNGWEARQVSNDWLRMAVRVRLLERVQCDEEMSTRMRNMWRQVWVSMYIDDLHGVISRSERRARQLCDVIKASGCLLMGPSAWSQSKAEEEGYFALLQKYTGIVINTALAEEPRASFTPKRLRKCLEIVEFALKDPEAEMWPLEFFQKGFGNLVWLYKVYRPFRAFAVAYRRGMQSVSSSAEGDTMVSPKGEKEGKAAAAKKFLRDNEVAKMMLKHLVRQKVLYGENHMDTTVPLSSLVDVEDLLKVDFRVEVGSIGGDASGTAWSIFDHRLREYMEMPMPDVLREVISGKDDLDENDVRKQFMIAIAEHMVLIIAGLQWGARWKQLGIHTVRYCTDNQNSKSWTKSGFAGCAVAQDLCRLMCALELVYGVQFVAEWVASLVNQLADYSTRRINKDGTTNAQMAEQFESINASLTEPYVRVEPKMVVSQLVAMVALVSDPYKLSEEMQGMLNELFAAVACDGEEASESSVSLSRSRAGFAASHSGSAMWSQLHEYREGWTIAQAMERCRCTQPRYSVGLVGAAAHIATMGVTRAGGTIAYFSETDELRLRMGELLTGKCGLGDFFSLDWRRLPKASVMLLTLPCINHSRSGDKTGRHGVWGWMFVEARFAVLTSLPKVFVFEISDYAPQVNNGEDVNMVKETLQEKYVIYDGLLRMADFGDCCHRVRYVIVGMLKEMPGAATWSMPAPLFDESMRHCARDIAEPDEAVRQEDIRKAPLHTVYQDVAVPAFGEMQKIGRLKPGFAMGPGVNPYLCLGWDGVKNGPTGYGGGGTFPPLEWRQGEAIPWRRVTTLLEYYREASLSRTVMLWHYGVVSGRSDELACLTDEQQDAEMAKMSIQHRDMLRSMVADGFFVRTVDTLMSSIFAHMEAHGVEHDDHGRSVPKQYVVQQRWEPSVNDDRRGGDVSPQAPSRQERQQLMGNSNRDWSEPLFPSKRGFRHHLRGPMTDEEFAQMTFGERVTDGIQLEDNSRTAYNCQLMKAQEFMERYPVTGTFSAEHAKTGLLFEPTFARAGDSAGWSNQEVQVMLCEMVMHEAFVRGNSWSSAHQLIYAIRHLNVKHLGIDVLKNKPRLKQLMSGLKKLKGKKKGKHPVTIAMLMAVREMLPINEDIEAHKMWTAVLTAFHFMLRSMDYCAKLRQGKFSMDQVLRVCDVIFKKKGVQIYSNFFAEAEEVVLVLGRGKTTEGGEVRSQFRAEEADLCVVRALGSLYDRMGRRPSGTALFAWQRGTKKVGDGVRYCDVMGILKKAAEICGEDGKDYGTHSCRRGGACAYLKAGKSFDDVAIFGRWKDASSCRLYIEPAAAFLMKGAQDRVNRGDEESYHLLRQPPREREQQMKRVMRRAAMDE